MSQGAEFTPAAATDRYARANAAAAREAITYFGVGLRSVGYETQIGTFRRLLRLVELTPAEEPTYSAWLRLTRDEAITASRPHRPPMGAPDPLRTAQDSHILAVLRARDDPAAHLHDQLLEVGMNLDPHLATDEKKNERALAAAGVILRSIHAAQLDELLRPHAVQPASVAVDTPAHELYSAANGLVFVLNEGYGDPAGPGIRGAAVGKTA